MSSQPLRYAVKARSEPWNFEQATLTWQPQSLHKFWVFLYFAAQLLRRPLRSATPAKFC